MIGYGSFEGAFLDKPEHGVFEGWSFRPAPNAEGTTRIGTVSATARHPRPGGGNCLEFEFTAAGEIGMGLWEKISISPDSKFVFSIWAKSAGQPVKIAVDLIFLTIPQDDGTLKQRMVPLKFETTGEWKKWSIPIASQQNETLFHVKIRATSQSGEPHTLWLDEASLDQVE